MPNLTLEQMQEFLETDKNATAGDWEVGIYKSTNDFQSIKTHCAIAQSGGRLLAVTGAIEDLQSGKDALFIAHSCSIAPQAVRELMEARKLLKKAQVCFSAIERDFNFCMPILPEIKEFLGEG